MARARTGTRCRMGVAQSIVIVAEAQPEPWQLQPNYHPVALDRAAKSTSAAPLLGPRSREVKHWDTPRDTVLKQLRVKIRTLLLLRAAMDSKPHDMEEC